MAISKKMGYWATVVWVAENDEPTIKDREQIEGFISVLLVADIFGRYPSDVALDVWKYRTGFRNRYTGGRR